MTKINKILVSLAVIFLFNACGVVTPHLGGLNPPVSNPFKELANVQVVRCTGNRSAATVEFVFTVTAHSNLITKGTFGSFPNSKFTARGTAYKPYRDAGTSVELVRYTPSEVVMTVNQVPDYLTQFDRIELAWYFNPSHHSGTNPLLVFHNIPIVWQ
jgi:hypothetical protein